MQNPTQQELENHERLIRGVISRVTFNNPSNGYCVLQVSIPEQSEALTVVGNLANPTVGANLLVRGTYKQHQKFGKQLQASSITEVAPTTVAGIEKYLGSGLIKGVGEKTAQRLVDEFGEKTLDIIYQDPERVAALAGIGKKKAYIIHDAYRQQKETQEIVRFLVEHGVSPHLAQKIYEQYKAKTVEVISKDPYLLARQLKGIGFATADSIAMNLGIKPDAPQRLRAGIYFALEKATEDGHCYLPESELQKRARILLGLEEEQDLTHHLEMLIEENFVVKKEEALYLKHLFQAEEFVAQFISARLTPHDTPEIDENKVNNALKEASTNLGITFSYEQQQAVHQAVRCPFLVITGGPGCGKTTIIRALSIVFRKANKRLLLAAPTGRAAQRISQVCDFPASTIHRLLKFDPRTGRFLHGINEPLQVDAIIVDEASMIDILLAKDLFSAIPKNATLILVGDKDQLPSVGPGKVFADLISTKEINTIALSKLFRRSEESHINTVAHMINSGIMPDIPQPDGVTKSDAYFLAKREQADASQTIEKLVSDQIPRKFGIPLSDITVVTPSNRGILGTIELNKKLQARINPPSTLGNDGEIEVGDLTFRMGDRVCQRVNNYQIDAYGVFNGDTGQIYSVDRAARQVVVELWDGRLIKYESGDLHQLSLAYAVTVHRSQGSEIPCVVLALTDAHFTLLERQLIYTAVTRAKKLLIVVGSKRALNIACKRTSTSKRCTRLREMIQQSLK